MMHCPGTLHGLCDSSVFYGRWVFIPAEQGRFADGYGERDAGRRACAVLKP
eukprot:SAG11_NODE_685_length_7739_cov_3.487435_3_plen_51_part_00